MKILHDLKNPVQALVSTINDSQLERENLCLIANADLEDISDMLDNLKTEFKSRNKMEYKEELRDVNSIDFLENISRAHIRLSVNGNNNFDISIDNNVPPVVRIPKLSVARICNNLISNALKHTTSGTVSARLKMPRVDELTDATYLHNGKP